MEVSPGDLVEFADLCQDDMLCDDVTLQTEGKNVRAHRAILAASSQYFRAMFSGNFKEAKEEVISLDRLGVPSEGLSVIVNSLYSLKLDITKENYDLVLVTAIVLQFTKIILLCEEFIQNNLDTKNCIQILQICETFGMDSLKNIVHLFLLKNFISVSQENAAFVKMDKDHLLEYVSDDRLCTAGNQIDLYRAVMKWIKFKPIRNRHITELLQHIRFYLIPIYLITDEIARELKNNERCIEWLKKAIDYHMSPYKQPFLQTLPPRGELTMIMLETSGRNISWNLLPFPKAADKLEIIKRHSLPGLNSRSYVIPFCVQNFLYLLYTVKQKTEWCHARYDPVSDKWLALAPPPYDGIAPLELTRATLSKSLLICGGWIPHGGVLSTCYTYSIEQNTWDQTSNSPEPLFDGLSCVHNECVYIASYYSKEDSEGFLANELQLLMYDSRRRKWSRKATPLHYHANGIFATVGDRLFIAGGSSSSYYDNYGGDDHSRYQMTAEVYDIKSDQWTYLLIQHPNLNIDLLCKLEMVKHFVIDKTIYCFGLKKSGEDADYENINLIFDTETGEVTHNLTWKRNYLDVMELVKAPIECSRL